MKAWHDEVFHCIRWNDMKYPIKVIQMHEVSLMTEIFSIVYEAATTENITEITEIKISVGKDLLVMQDALQFAFENLKRGGPAESAMLLVEESEGRDLRVDYFEGE